MRACARRGLRGLAPSARQAIMRPGALRSPRAPLAPRTAAGLGSCPRAASARGRTVVRVAPGGRPGCAAAASRARLPSLQRASRHPQQPVTTSRAGRAGTAAATGPPVPNPRLPLPRRPRQTRPRRSSTTLDEGLRRSQKEAHPGGRDSDVDQAPASASGTRSPRRRGRVRILLQRHPAPTLSEVLAQVPSTSGRRSTSLRCCDRGGCPEQAGLAARDLKPDRILVSPHRGAILADPGIPLRASAPDRGPDDPDSAFRSPEEHAGLPIDGRSNVYSAGGGVPCHDNRARRRAPRPAGPGQGCRWARDGERAGTALCQPSRIHRHPGLRVRSPSGTRRRPEAIASPRAGTRGARCAAESTRGPEAKAGCCGAGRDRGAAHTRPNRSRSHRHQAAVAFLRHDATPVALRKGHASLEASAGVRFPSTEGPSRTAPPVLTAPPAPTGPSARAPARCSTPASAGHSALAPARCSTPAPAGRPAAPAHSFAPTAAGASPRRHAHPSRPRRCRPGSRRGRLFPRRHAPQ